MVATEVMNDSRRTAWQSKGLEDAVEVRFKPCTNPTRQRGVERNPSLTRRVGAAEFARRHSAEDGPGEPSCSLAARQRRARRRGFNRFSAKASGDRLA